MGIDIDFEGEGSNLILDLHQCYKAFHIDVELFFDFQIILFYLAMGQEHVGHLIALLPHVFVVTKLLHCILQDVSQASAVLRV